MHSDRRDEKLTLSFIWFPRLSKKDDVSNCSVTLIKHDDGKRKEARLNI